MKTAPIIETTIKHRHYFECEHGARWSEVEWQYDDDTVAWNKSRGIGDDGLNDISKDGDFCYFSGCKENDHKIKFVFSSDGDNHEQKYKWFRTPIR